MNGDQLTRDELLRHRLFAAAGDAKVVTELLQALADDSPPSASDQEENMRYIESALQSVRYNCKRLREYKP